jgi:tight adherence protein C
MLPDFAASVDQFVEANGLPLLAATVFGLVFVVAVVAVQLAQTRTLVKRRTIAFNPAHSGRSWGSSFGSKSRTRNNDVEAASELLFAVERGLAAGGEVRLSRVRRELIRAGYFSREALLYYYLTRVVLACMGAYVLHGLALTVTPDPQPSTTLALAVIGASLGLLTPALYVRRRHALLHEQCRNGFPTFLDLLVVCSEAGLAPRAGIERVSREITRTYPFLGANLFLMSLELRAGRPLTEAVEGLGRRINLDEARSLGSLLHQTEELGGNLTNALRVFSDEMRARRFLRAEEKAYSLPVKLVLPLALFVFPGMLIVTLLPVIIRAQRAFF